MSNLSLSKADNINNHNNGNPSFAVDLWDAFPCTVKLGGSSLASLKEMHSFFKKRALIEENYAKELAKLHLKINVQETDLSGDTMYDAWEAVISATFAQANTHSLVAATLKDTLASATKLACKQHDEKLRNLVNEGNRLNSEQTKSVAALKKSRDAYYKAHRDVDAARTLYEDALKEKTKAHELQKLEKKMQKVEQEKQVLEQEYQSQIQDSNTFLSSLENELMPKLMDDFEKLEMDRIDVSKEQLNKFVGCLNEVPTKTSSLLNSLQQSVKSIDAKADIIRFINSNKSDKARPPPFEYEAFDPSLLSESQNNNNNNNNNDPNQSKGKGFASLFKKGGLFKKETSVTNTNANLNSNPSTPTNSPPNSSPTTPVMKKEQGKVPVSPQSLSKIPIFGLSIDDFLKRQNATHSHLDVPLPLIELALGILILDGPVTEGIFRVPAPASGLGKLIKQFEEGNYSIDVSENENSADVHAVAGLFKKILRDIPAPLIPINKYDECIAVTTPNEAIDKVSGLDPQSLNLLTFLVKFLRVFIKPECVERSRMNADNLAMVFVPSILRSPSEDLTMALANVPNEKQFVRFLIEKLPVDGEITVENLRKLALPTNSQQEALTPTKIESPTKGNESPTKGNEPNSTNHNNNNPEDTTTFNNNVVNNTNINNLGNNPVSKSGSAPLPSNLPPILKSTLSESSISKPTDITPSPSDPKSVDSLTTVSPTITRAPLQRNPSEPNTRTGNERYSQITNEGEVSKRLSVSQDKMANELCFLIPEVIKEFTFLGECISHTHSYNHTIELSKPIRALKKTLDVVTPMINIDDDSIMNTHPILPKIGVPNDEEYTEDKEFYQKFCSLRKLLSAVLIEVVQILMAIKEKIGNGFGMDEMEGYTLLLRGVRVVLEVTRKDHPQFLAEEARYLSRVAHSKLTHSKTVFSSAPADQAIDMAKPILSISKDLETFFAAHNLAISLVESEPTLNLPYDASDEREEKLHRMRIMLLITVTKLESMLLVLLENVEIPNPNSDTFFSKIVEMSLL